MKKSDVFNKFLETFETDEMRDYCRDMLEKCPNYIWRIPSSTSYKYHNKTQCQPGGQLYHILMACEIMNYILGLKYIKEKWCNPKQRDCFRVAICLHDSTKCGLNENEPLFTQHEHPIWCSDWIKKTEVDHDIDDKLKKYIGRLVASHSGEWTFSHKTPIVLPEVENDEQFLIHLCDYLSSRSNIDMIYDEETIDTISSFQERPSIDTYKMPFGKHSGKLLSEIPIEYLQWLSTTDLKEPLRSLVKEVVG